MTHPKPLKDVWIGLDVRQRQANWFWTILFSVVCLGMAAVIYAPAPGDSPADRRWGSGAAIAFWLAGFIYLVNRGYGTTKLTSKGMQFRSFFSHRFIAWEEITRIEMHRHRTRGGSWWDIRVYIAGGQKRPVPGAFTFNSQDKALQVLEQKLGAIRTYWSSAVGPANPLRM